MESLYTPLNPGDLRLLRLLDSTGLKWSLTTYRQVDAPAYYALSYEWRGGQSDDSATPTEQRKIEVNGRMVEVQNNLSDALNCLGSMIFADGLHIWIDFISINQADHSELSEQVQKMNSIFEQATEVLGWLGLAHNEEKTREGVALMRKISNYLSPRDYSDDALHQALIARLYFPGETAPEIVGAWQSMGEILGRTYWYRTWIQQEATVPRIRFFCGNHSFNGDDLTAACIFHRLYYFESEFCLPKDYIFPYNVNSARYNRSSAAASNATHTEGFCLIPLLIELRETFCSDPRDKVFATMSRATDVTPDRIAVDYNKSIVQVYIAVVLFALDFWHGLDILGLVAHYPDALPWSKANTESFETPLPPWAPDWRRRISIKPFNYSAGSEKPYRTCYEPCPDTMRDVHISEGELHVRGFIFDSILMTSIGCNFPTETVYRIRTGSSFLRDNGAQFTDHAINRTAVGDIWKEWDEQIDDWFVKRGAAADWDLLDSSIADLDHDSTTRQNLMRDRVAVVCDYRTMGYTEHGHLGIFPTAAVEGDRIAAFHGGYALYVIRPISGEQDKYHFLGECYVDEMMDGQAMKLAAERGIDSRVLILV